MSWWRSQTGGAAASLPVVPLFRRRLQEEELFSPGPAALLHRPSLRVQTASGPRESDQLPRCAKGRTTATGVAVGGATPAATVRKGRIAAGGAAPPALPRKSCGGRSTTAPTKSAASTVDRNAKTTGRTVDDGRGSGCRGRQALAALREGRVRPARNPLRRRAAVVTQTTPTKKLR